MLNDHVMLNEQVVYSQRLALQVERYHTWPKVRGQSVGEHTAQVMRIYVRLFGSPRAEVWNAILEHDMPEMRFGDLPFSGDYAPELKVAKAAVERRVQQEMSLHAHLQISAVEERRIKLCDLMDCFEWGMHEQRLGSAFGRVVSLNVGAPIVELATALGCTATVKDYMSNVEDRP